MPRKTDKRADANRHRAMVRRLVRHWEAATAADRAAGLDWYDRAADAAATLAADSRYSPTQCAAAIAALSPRTSWRENLYGAREIVAYCEADADGHDVGPYPRLAALGANVHKAVRILSGEAPADVLGGPKVRAFFANITGDTDAVTVDAWAVRAATGAAEVPTERVYRLVAAAYVEAAGRVGVAPRDFQAAIWVHVRGSAD